MKLNEQQIRFIDTYLKNSGVKYVDIRYEMTDHVATALEEMAGDFEDNFRSYMLENKKSLLESYREYGILAGKTAVRLILGNLVKLRFLLAAVILYCLIYVLAQIVTFELISDSISACQTLAMIAFIIYYKYWRGNQNLKFSVINKVFGVTAVSVYFVVLFLRTDNWLDNPDALMVWHACFSAFLCEIPFTFRDLAKKYRIQYGN